MSLVRQRSRYTQSAVSVQSASTEANYDITDASNLTCLFISVVYHRHYTVSFNFPIPSRPTEFVSDPRVPGMTNPAPAADRPEMTGAGLLLLLLLLASRSPRPAAAVGGACPMNASTPVPAGAQLLVGEGVLRTDERSYAPSEYRTARDGHGYVLCACEIKPCVRKCCGPGKIYELAKRCTKSTAAGDAPVNFTVGSHGCW